MRLLVIIFYLFSLPFIWIAPPLSIDLDLLKTEFYTTTDSTTSIQNVPNEKLKNLLIIFIIMIMLSSLYYNIVSN